MQGNSSAADNATNVTSPILSDSWFRSELYGLDRMADDFPRIRQGELADLLANNAA